MSLSPSWPYSLFSIRIFSSKCTHTQFANPSFGTLDEVVEGLQPQLSFSCHSLPTHKVDKHLQISIYTKIAEAHSYLESVRRNIRQNPSSSLHPCLSKTAPSRLKPAQLYEPKNAMLPKNVAREPAVICNAEETQQQIVPPICPPVLIRYPHHHHPPAGEALKPQSPPSPFSARQQPRQSAAPAKAKQPCQVSHRATSPPQPTPTPKPHQPPTAAPR